MYDSLLKETKPHGVFGSGHLILFLRTVQHELPTRPSITTETKRFTYSEVVALTDNFERVLGEGGFGVVYHGSLNGTQPIAVKLLSQSSVQGYKEFKAEVCQD